MKHRLPSHYFGLRVSAKFACAAGGEHEPIVVTRNPTRWASGGIYAPGTYSNHGNPVIALMAWLMPAGETGQTALARCVSANPATGEIEADCYGESAGRVLDVFRRLGAREMDAHSISV